MSQFFHFFFISLQPTPTSKFLQGYAGAVTSAVSIAVSELLQHFFLPNTIITILILTIIMISSQLVFLTQGI